LHENTPTTDGYLDPTQQPQYGVLATWDMGHLIRYVAERPLVQDNFGVYGGREQFLAGWQYFGTGDEKEALRIVEQLGVRYVLIDGMSASLGERSAPDSMTDRLYVPRGGREAKDGQATLALSPLRHHRLIMETSLAQPKFPHVMIYEIVKGAQIQGRAVPGAVVHLRLPIRSTMRSAAFTYRTQSVARADGRYRFAVPYSTGGVAPVRTGKKYVLRCGEESAAVEVSESSVVSGAEVAGPELRCMDAKR
jgi:dolichyl-diphosphooligosaccharide--protein glycosyltransferase